MDNEAFLSLIALAVAAVVAFWYWRQRNALPDHMRELQRQLAEARLGAVSHAASAEMHAAMAHVYRLRVKRLDGAITPISGEAGDTQFGSLV